MDLILWRHAQAHDWVAGPDDDLVPTFEQDLARALTPKGERQAERMGDWLDQRLPQAARVLVSPAVRTQQTAKAMGRSYKVLPSIHPEATVDDLLAAARWPDGPATVVIVGHQPTLGLLAARLMTGQDLPWSIKKGAVWWLKGREREGQAQVNLHAVHTPELL
jgi:phosphohistidine phosphatase